MAVLQVALVFLFSFKLVLAQSSSYTLIVQDVGTDVKCLSCLNSSTNVFADIDKVKFWRNRILSNNQGLRERRDIAIFEDQARNDIAFTLTRNFEGNYTCGRQLMDTIEESPPVILVCKLIIYTPLNSQSSTIVCKDNESGLLVMMSYNNCCVSVNYYKYAARKTFNVLVDHYDDTFYAIPRNQAVLHCPIQPGVLTQYYYGRWEKNGDTLVTIPQPIHGNPQDIVRSESRYDLNKTTFSLIINSVEASDAGDNYQCFLNVVDPRNDPPYTINLQTGSARLTLMVKGKPLHYACEINL